MSTMDVSFPQKTQLFWQEKQDDKIHFGACGEQGGKWEAGKAGLNRHGFGFWLCLEDSEPAKSFKQAYDMVI